MINGGANNDTIYGFLGDNKLDRGPGSDTVSYAYAYAGRGVEVSLGVGSATGWGEDRLESVENVRGSRYSDSIEGDRTETCP